VKLTTKAAATPTAVNPTEQAVTAVAAEEN